MTPSILRLIGMAAVLALFGVSIELAFVSGQLEKERLHHAATAKERDTWKLAAEASQKASLAQQDNAQACLDREVKARTDAEARAAILSQARLRPKSANDTVVDDATRNAMADRLNRAL